MYGIADSYLSEICFKKIERVEIMKQIKITETVLRDAQQSLIATRMPRSDFEDIL